jgi:phosphonatase-like hydrolase
VIHWQKKMKISLIVFDLAGTTVKDNRDVHHVLQKALRKSGVEISIEDANEVMGIPKPVAIRLLLEKRHIGQLPITESWISEIHHQFVEEMIAFYDTSPTVQEKEGVSETFAVLKNKGIKIAVDTGFNRSIVTPLLKRVGWTRNNLIDCSVASDGVLRGRPYPDLIFEAMRQTGVSDVTKVIKVGDTASDIQEGKAAGCGITVGITSGAFTREALTREHPTYLIASIPELLQIVSD